MGTEHQEPKNRIDPIEALREQVKITNDELASVLQQIQKDLLDLRLGHRPPTDVHGISTLLKEVRDEQRRIGENLNSLSSLMTTVKSNTVDELRWWVAAGAFFSVAVAGVFIIGILLNQSNSGASSVSERPPQVFVLPAVPAQSLSPQEVRPAPQVEPGQE